MKNMEIENYPGNSQSAKSTKDKKVLAEASEETPKVPEKIVSGNVIRRKKPWHKRAADLLFGGSSPRDIWAYVLLDVLVPAGRDAIANSAREGIELLVYPDGRNIRHRSGSRHRSSSNRIRYDVISDRGHSSDYRRDISRRARSVHDFDEILLDSRVAAEEVIQQLYEYLERYEEVTVSQLYSLLGIKPAYTDDKYGWMDLRGLRPVRTRGGQYLLDLPKPELLD